MNIKRCLSCNNPLDWDGHGNRNYCNNDCYVYQKNLRTNKRYWEQKAVLDVFQKSDLVLKYFFDLYGPGQLISAVLLENKGMDWHVCKKEITLDGNLAILIDQYAYCLFTDLTLKIWKL